MVQVGSKKIKRVIIICGKAESGKTTFANLLETLVNAYHSKIVCGVINNGLSVKELAVEYFHWDGIKDTKGRQLLIDVTNSGYNYDPLFWEKKTYQRFIEAQEVYPDLETLVIPDWRYSSTKEYFESMSESVITMRVNRNSDIESTHSKDSSELTMDSFETDYTLSNDSDISNLKDSVEEIAKHLNLI